MINLYRVATPDEHETMYDYATVIYCGCQYSLTSFEPSRVSLGITRYRPNPFTALMQTGTLRPQTD